MKKFTLIEIMAVFACILAVLFSGTIIFIAFHFLQKVWWFMNIYLLKLNHQGYNCYEGFVVVANTKQDALDLMRERILESYCDNEDDCLDNDVESFTQVGTACDSIKSASILLYDYTRE